jgi:hypothetical protein
MRKMACLFGLLVVLFVFSPASAASYWAHYFHYSNPGPSDTLWSNPGNWSNGEVPTIANTQYAAYQLVGSGDLMQIDGAYAEVSNFITGGWGGTDNTELMNGTYFYVHSPTAGSGQVYLGEATPESSAPCVFTNNGGTMYVTGQMMVGGSGGTGNGSYVQNAGTFTSDWRLWVSDLDDVQLNGGIMTVGYLQIDATALMDFAGGDLWFGGYSPEDAAALVESYIGGGQMTAFDDTGSVQYAFDEAQGKMHVWGVPEPATITLFALSGLLLGRKRK